MNEKFERVTERHGGEQIHVKHLYRRQYQTASGEWRTVLCDLPGNSTGTIFGVPIVPGVPVVLRVKILKRHEKQRLTGNRLFFTKLQ